VLKLRNFLNDEKYVNKDIFFNQILQDKLLLCDYIFNNKIIEILEKKYGDVYFITDFVVQKNNRTNKRGLYHKDSGKFHQSKMLSNAGTLWGKVGILLQDNIRKVGGGLDILRPIFFDNLSDSNIFWNKIRALYYILQDFFFSTHIPTKAGDVIFFEANISHRSSYTDNINIKKNIIDKLVVYYQFTNRKTIESVLQKIKSEYINCYDSNIQVVDYQGNKIKILNQEISSQISNYMGA